MLGTTFQCPLGNKHYGIGFCVYSGDFCRGFFHGEGEVQCMSGQYYRGKWKYGKKHGEVSQRIALLLRTEHNPLDPSFVQGEQYFIRNGELGDVQRMCIGGTDFLYRVKLYQGQYEDDFRQGPGMITYTNGDSLSGHFQRGQPHGTMVYTFAISKTTKIAKYVRGERAEWIELKRWSMLNTNNRLHGAMRVSVSATGKNNAKGKNSGKGAAHSKKGDHSSRDKQSSNSRDSSPPSRSTSPPKEKKPSPTRSSQLQRIDE